jgi:hypothetical protein
MAISFLSIPLIVDGDSGSSWTVPRSRRRPPADASRLSTMSRWDVDISVVDEVLGPAFRIRPRSVQREGLAQRFTLGPQLDAMAVMDDSVEYCIRQSGFTEVGMPCIHRQL